MSEQRPPCPSPLPYVNQNTQASSLFPQQQLYPPPQQQFSSQPHPYQYPPPGYQFNQHPASPSTMLYAQTGRDQWSIMTPDRSQVLYTIRYSSHSLGMTLLRGTDSGPVVGTAKFHSFTTSKVDLEFHGREFRFKKEFDSGTGLGHAAWKSHGHDLLLRDSSGRLVASFLLDGSVQSSHHREGRLETTIQGLRSEHLEEILMTGLAELERIRRDTEDLAIGVRAGIHAG